MKKEWIKSVVLVVLGAVIYSVGTQYFVVPAQIAPGGAVGIALMINHLTALPIGTLTLLINLPLLVLAWFYLSRQFTVRTAIATVLVTIILDFIVTPICPQYAGDRLLSSVYGGIVVGVGMAFIFLAGFTTGGTDIAGYLLQKKFPHYSIGHALMIIEGIILVMSIFVFQDVDAGLFGLISVYVQTKVIDMILYGSDAGSQAIIVTKHPQEIADRVIQELERTATILPAKGAYSGDPIDVVLCTVRKSEFVRLKRIIGQCDPSAFVMANETSEVLGLGFKGFTEVV
ncbi:YitT family protein [Flintibacter sp. KGMB00164]|uniref:YitT family protein n=1 Tax=Flintibacter sp. KGMB00164 TaxID=2610895 RepID=UPI0012475C01|nr:YitT family protein [Flintibacter sp. KGMB00164]